MNPVGLLVIGLSALIIIMGVKGTQRDVLKLFASKPANNTTKKGA